MTRVQDDSTHYSVIYNSKKEGKVQGILKEKMIKFLWPYDRLAIKSGHKIFIGECFMKREQDIRL